VKTIIECKMLSVPLSPTCHPLFACPPVPIPILCPCLPPFVSRTYYPLLAHARPYLPHSVCASPKLTTLCLSTPTHTYFPLHPACMHASCMYACTVAIIHPCTVARVHACTSAIRCMDVLKL